MEIIEQLPDIRGEAALPIREAQTLSMELLMRKALDGGMEAAILDSPVYHRYLDVRQGGP